MCQVGHYNWLTEFLPQLFVLAPGEKETQVAFTSPRVRCFFFAVGPQNQLYEHEQRDTELQSK